MNSNNHTRQNLFLDIWNSFRAIPGWVQFWMVFLLMPINMASLFFLSEPMGLLVAFLANIGMLLNLPVLIKERGLSKLMSGPHLIPWTILVILILFKRPETDGVYDLYLTVLLITNIISLVFDYPDFLKWIKGDRAIARK